MSEQKIKSIEKGWGDNSTYFTTDPKYLNENMKVDEIKEENKHIGIGEYGDIEILVFRGYKNEKLVFEISSKSDITLVFS